MGKEVYDISGMTCASCSSAVERVTRKLEGVVSSEVNLATNKMTIEYDENILQPEAIIKKIERAGFGAELTKDKLKEEIEQEKENASKDLNRIRRRLIISIIVAIPLLYVSMEHMVPITLPMPAFFDMHQNPLNFALLQLVLTTVILICGRKFYSGGFKALFAGNPNMDSLVAIGTSSAFIYSLVMTYKIPSDVSAAMQLYYETAAVVITLVMLGKYLESRSKGKTSEAIEKLMELSPDKAIIVDGSGEREVDTASVRCGDIILVKPGSKIPLDGDIVKGATSVDESMLTGESIPVERSLGDNVIGGSMNYNGAIQVKVTHTGSDTTLAKIIKLMEDAQGKKAPISKMADIVAGYFVPIVIAIAIISAISWAIAGEPINFVLKIFVSVLVIACPCALGLATPTAIMVGTGRGAGLGILIKSGEALEITHKANTVVLDKTGTITEGKPRVVEVISNWSAEDDLLGLAASCEVESEHPLGQAIVQAARERNISLTPTNYFNSITGQGIEAKIDDKHIYIGNAKMLRNIGVSADAMKKAADEIASKGQTPMFVVIDKQLAGLISVADTIKSSSTAAIEDIKKLGIKVYMLTGDNAKTAKYIGDQVHVDEVISEVLPQDKVAVIAKLQKEGRKVIMVGDGINDAPALAQAEIGIAIGNGSDIAMESSDIVLMKSDLQDVYKAIALSNATIRNIKQNLFWAFIFNSIGIPIAAGLLHVFGGPLLNPIFAGMAMAFSSVLVVINALRLKHVKLRNRAIRQKMAKPRNTKDGIIDNPVMYLKNAINKDDEYALVESKIIDGVGTTTCSQHGGHENCTLVAAHNISIYHRDKWGFSIPVSDNDVYKAIEEQAKKIGYDPESNKGVSVLKNSKFVTSVWRQGFGCVNGRGTSNYLATIKKIRKSIDEGRPFIYSIAQGVYYNHSIVVRGYEIYRDSKTGKKYPFLVVSDGWSSLTRYIYKKAPIACMTSIKMSPENGSKG